MISGQDFKLLFGVAFILNGLINVHDALIYIQVLEELGRIRFLPLVICDVSSYTFALLVLLDLPVDGQEKDAKALEDIVWHHVFIG